MDIQILAKNLNAARKVTEDAGIFHADVSKDYADVHEEIRATLEAAGHTALLMKLDTTTSALQASDAELKAAKKAEKEAEEALRLEAEKEALLMQAQGKEPFGRLLHPHIEIKRKFVVEFPNDPYIFGAAMTELVEKGKRDLIEIKLTGNTDWFRDTIFRTPIHKRELPLIAIDSVKTWPIVSE